MGLADYREKYIDTSGGNNMRGSIKRVAALNPKDFELQRKARLIETEAQLLEIEKRQREQKILYYKPYPKQLQFHAQGHDFRERLLMAGNRTGKTYCGGAETAYHLTGMYPKWWQGRVFTRPPRGWAAGVTAEKTRDVIQTVLFGTKGEGVGTGMIPKDRIGTTTMARGVSDLYDTILVKHNTGGWSELKFKSYERGQEKWQGDTLDFIWFDEEPPLDVYTEGYTRCILNKGLMWMTFTPLKGKSEVVNRFLDPKSDGADARVITQMSMADAEHISAEDRATAIAGWPEYQREAREKGVPLMGSGAVFPIAESAVTCDPFDIPKHWSWLWGLDFGVAHPFGAVLVAWDRDSDVMYVTHTVRLKNQTPLVHAESMKQALDRRGGIVPVAWPHDVNQRREFEGALVPMAEIYKKYGLKMYSTHATFTDGSNSTEVGIGLMFDRMQSGRLKVFRHCGDWFDEFRNYHRVDGVINKDNDDLMSATRMAVMMQRIAKPVLFFEFTPGGRTTQVARDIDIDPWM